MSDFWLYQGDCVKVMQSWPDASVDAVVCDPPYEIGFMGRDWDKAGVAFDPATWREALRVLKPGGHLLAFGGSRTFHRMACAIEDAGFQIRDCVMWLYSTGFPKSRDVAYDLHQKAEQEAERDVRFVLARHLSKAVYACHECGQVLLTCLSESGAPGAWRTWAESQIARSPEPSVEGWSHAETPERELQRCPVCSLSHGIFADGAFGWVRYGAPAGDGAGTTAATTSHGSSASREPQPSGQLRVEPGAVRIERRAQAIRGYGTALKPAHEPVILARKPLDGTVAANVQKWGTGALNIDGCRVRFQSEADKASAFPGGKLTSHGSGSLAGPGAAQDATRSGFHAEQNALGRWPANVMLDEEAAAMLDAQSGVSKSGVAVKRNLDGHFYGSYSGGLKAVRSEDVGFGDTGGASRFFYVAKTSRRERDHGLEAFPARSGGEATDREDGSAGLSSPRAGAGRTGGARNPHPTVKPVALMRQLVRLVTPPGGIVLDPFVGSGSTGMAARLEGARFVGIDLSEEYLAIAHARIAAALTLK